MHILHLNQRNQRNQILFQYLRDKEKKRKKGAQKKGGVKIHPFHLPWIRAWKGNQLVHDHTLLSFYPQREATGRSTQKDLCLKKKESHAAWQRQLGTGVATAKK